MNEGTQFGQKVLDDSIPISAFSDTETVATEQEGLSGTKIGEVSDFEKSLFLDQDTAPISKKDISETVIEPEEPVEDVSVISDYIAQDDDQAPIAEDIGGQNKDFLAQIEETDAQASLQSHLEKTVLDYQQGDIIKGIVRKIEKSGVLVDIQFKSEGFIPNSEFSMVPGETPAGTVKPGDEINVFIMKLETKEGYTLLSRKRAEYEMSWNYLNKICKSRETIDIIVTSNVEGGLVVDYKGIKGFIPASHVLKNSDDKLDTFLNSVLTVVVLQVERKRRKVIFSHKLAKSRPAKADLDKVIDSIEVGQVYSGIVSSIKDFGAFVSINGAEGLVHISELSWARVNHPSEMLSVGDQVQVFVLGVDRENQKISLGMKQLQSDPWVRVTEKYHVGQYVQGKISRLISFGAFIQIESDLEGLIHISELSYDHIEKVEDAVVPGKIVNAKIIKLIPDEQKIGLTLKGVDQSADIQSLNQSSTAESTGSNLSSGTSEE